MAGGGKALFAERLRPFLKGRPRVTLHVTGVQQNDTACRVQGYVEGSALGELRLPGDLQMVQEGGAWKWQGGANSNP